MSDPTISNNKPLNQLIRYIDHDLVNVLTDDQRDNLYALALSSVAIDIRHKSANDRARQVLPENIHRNIHYGEPTPNEYGCKWWICRYKYPIMIRILSMILLTLIPFIQ